MDKLHNDFLKYASSVLAGSKNGLTKRQIEDYFLRKGVELGIGLKNIRKQNIDKSELLLKKLSNFDAITQCKIILDICEQFERKEFKQLKKIVMDKCNSNNLQAKSNNLYRFLLAIIFIMFISFLYSSILKKEEVNETSSKPLKCKYQFVLIDCNTFKTPIFNIPNMKLRIHNTTPPTIKQIVDGTILLECDSLINPILIEFDDSVNYQIIDRLHSLSSTNINYIYVRKIPIAKVQN